MVQVIIFRCENGPTFLHFTRLLQCSQWLPQSIKNEPAVLYPHLLFVIGWMHVRWWCPTVKWWQILVIEQLQEKLGPSGWVSVLLTISLFICIIHSFHTGDELCTEIQFNILQYHFKHTLLSFTYKLVNRSKTHKDCWQVYSPSPAEQSSIWYK